MQYSKVVLEVIHFRKFYQIICGSWVSALHGLGLVLELLFKSYCTVGRKAFLFFSFLRAREEKKRLFYFGKTFFYASKSCFYHADTLCVRRVKPNPVFYN
jgi:hypothetical protein